MYNNKKKGENIMATITLKLNTAYALIGEGYSFVKVQGISEGKTLGCNLNPTEWDAIASSLCLFDKVEVPFDHVEADAKGRTNAKGVVYLNAVGLDFAEAKVTPSPFAKAKCPAFATLVANAKASQTQQSNASEEEAVF
jgi:hypothetical protein